MYYKTQLHCILLVVMVINTHSQTFAVSGRQDYYVKVRKTLMDAGTV